MEANDHRGNIQPGLDLEEHDGLLNVKRTSVVSAATIYAVVNTGAAGVQNSMVTLNSGPNSIGLVTLNPSSAYIGLVTNTPVGLHTLAPSPNFIGFATIRIATNVNTNIGLVTVDGGTVKSLVSLSPSVSNIGFATVAIGANANTNIGLVTVDGGTVKSLVSLSASVSNIGFVTVFQAFPGGSTIYTQVISLTSFTTIAVAPASNMFFIKNLHISSLGRSEVEIRSGATTLIPFTSLSTTSGLDPYYGEYGLPSRAQADAFVVNLAVGSATIAVMANLRYGV